MSIPNGTVAPSRKNIGKLFDRLAPRYDALNRLLSLRQDVRWRRALIPHLPKGSNLIILDLATGTADIPLALCNLESIDEIVGIDISPEMLALGQRKIARAGLEKKILLTPGNAMDTRLPPSSFHAVTIGFGIRNVENPLTALKEMHRLLKPGGKALILEFSIPDKRFFRSIYLLYFRRILPVLGGLVSGQGHAYRYLNQSVETFPSGPEFESMMTRAGFGNVCRTPLSLGIVSLYTGENTGPGQ